MNTNHSDAPHPALAATPARAPSPRGFTLVELMIVVVLLGSMAALSAPSVLRSMERASSRGEARNIANTFRQARSLAMSRGQVVLVKVEGNDIKLIPSTNNAASCTTATFSDDVEPIHTYRVGTRFADVATPVVEPAAVGGAAGAVTPLCFSPGGRVVQLRSGLPFQSALPGCSSRNFRVFIYKESTAGGLSPLGLATCNAGLTARQEQRDKRDIHHFFAIHVPYNGGIEIEQ